MAKAMPGIEGNPTRNLSGAEEAHPQHGEYIDRSTGTLAEERAE